MSKETELTAIHKSLQGLHDKFDNLKDSSVTKHESNWKTGIVVTFTLLINGALKWEDLVHIFIK